MRKKKTEMNKEDRISHLEDEIIENIFSFLGNMTDMTEIVRTSLLSKRWRNLWTSAPNLVFDFLQDNDELENSPYSDDSDDDEDEDDDNEDDDDDDDDDEEYGFGRLGKFFKFINKVLSPPYTSSINKLSIQCYASTDDRITNKLIAAAVNRNVQEIHLHCNFDSGGELPDLLFTSQVKVFKFTNFCKGFKEFSEGGMWMPHSIAAAANIRKLELNRVVFHTIASSEVIINCAVLEYLTIKNCRIYDARAFTISAPLLNELALSGIDCQKGYMEREKNYCINVHSSNLKNLILSDYYFSGDFTLEDPSTLISAKLSLSFEDYKEQSPQCLMKVLTAISNVKTLSVPYHLVEVMANSPSMLELLANRFLNLRYIIMNEDFTGYFSYNAVATVLQTFPRRVNHVLNARDVPVDPRSWELLKKLLDQKDEMSSKNCQD